MLDEFTAGILARFITELRERIVNVSRVQPIHESTLFVEASALLNQELSGQWMYNENLHAWLQEAVREQRETPRSLIDLMAMAIDTVAAEYGFTRK